MVVGKIQQSLSARGLPPGVKMLITAVDFTIPPGDWWTGFQGPRKSIYNDSSDADKKAALPMEVSKDYFDGYMGIAYLSSTAVGDSGPGPEIHLKFQLSGTSPVDGKSIDFGNVQGSITISTTEWSKVTRPDYCNVSYSIQGGQLHNLSNGISVLQSPNDVNFVFGAKPAENEVGMNASTEEDVIKDLASGAIQGIFMAHEKAIGWVFGKL